MFENDEKINTVQLFYRDANGKILGVSRRHDHSDFGLPGGKIEKGETPIKALIREVKEETGITLNKYDVKPIYEAPSERSKKLSRTYMYIGDSKLEFTEGVHEDNGGYAKMVDWDDLLSGTFSVYNYRLGVKLNRFLPLHWFISYAINSDGLPAQFNNKIIDVHPLLWVNSENKKKQCDKITLISFQDIDSHEAKTYSNFK